MSWLNLKAYRLQGHWSFNHKLVKPEKYDYKDKVALEKKQLELWFVFYDNRPKEKNKLSLDDYFNLPGMLPDEIDNNPEAQQAIEDIKVDNRWREIVLMALDLYDIRDDYVKTGLKSFGKDKQSVIAQWSTHGDDKSESEYDWSRIINKNSKFYKDIVATFGDSDMFILRNSTKPNELSEYDECFVVDKVLEEREATVDDFTYRLKVNGERRKIGNVVEDIENAKNQALKQELKSFAKIIQKWT